MADLPKAGGVLGRMALRPAEPRTPFGRWVTLLLVACGAITVFFPFFWMAITSLKTAPEIQRVPLQVLPDSWANWQNYREVFARHPFARYLLNSALIASGAAVSSLVV